MKISIISLKTVFFLFLAIVSTNTVFAFSDKDNITIVVNDIEETVSYKEFSEWIDHEPILIHDPNSISQIENIHYCPFDSIFCKLLRSYRDKMHTQKKNGTIANEEKIKSFLDDLGRRINKDPVDAKFKIEDEKVVAFGVGEKGMKIDTESSISIIAGQLLKNNTPDKIALIYNLTDPNIDSDNIENMGIDTLIGEGKSNFRGSPRNRIHNIKVATSRFNGLLIKPGEEFSFVDILGEVDEEHGYESELVIKKNKTEPEFGGGICQVSTTVFRAAIYSGMEITARRNHAYPVVYYNPPGMDATIYIHRPDLRFVNNTTGHVLIQAKIVGTELTFQFYGTDDGRKIEIEGPKVLERNPDGSMKTVFTQSVYDKDGELIIEDTFKSAYDSPDKYPHPGEEKFTKKPKDWSSREWKDYKKTNGI